MLNDELKSEIQKTQEGFYFIIQHSSFNIQHFCDSNTLAVENIATYRSLRVPGRKDLKGSSFLSVLQISIEPPV